MTNVDEAVRWLSYTYLYVRMRINPIVYGINYAEKGVSLIYFYLDENHHNYVLSSFNKDQIRFH